jgi:Secretion system C-terminal sorting domain/Beta-propeller repeat
MDFIKKYITKKLIIGGLLICYNFSFAQPGLYWAKSFGGSGRDEGNSVVVDASGNLYTCGSFVNTVDFDPGAGTANATDQSVRDMYVSKFDANGNFVWTQNYGSAGSGRTTVATSMALDATGNIYITGWYKGVVDFGATSLSGGNFENAFVVKLNATGGVIWAKNVASSNGLDKGFSVDVDASGNVFIAGTYSFTTDFDPGAGTQNRGSSGQDIFVLKLTAAGNYSNVYVTGTAGIDQAFSLTIDGSNNIYVTGTTNGDVYVEKLNNALSSVTVSTTLGNTGNGHSGNSIVVDGANNIYIAGSFRGSGAVFKPGNGPASKINSAGGRDIFLVRLDANGGRVWGFGLGGSADDYAKSLAIDATGNLYIMGDFYTTAAVDFDPGGGIANMSNGPGAGTLEGNFIAQYDNAGAYLCSFPIKPGHNETEYDRQLAVNGTDLYLTTSVSSTSSTTDYDPCIGTTNVPLSGDNDAAIAKYDFSACNCPVVLPITLLSFAGESKGDYNLLQWQTSTEINNDFFTIEKSKDAITWEIVETLSGAGNSNTTLSYSMADDNPYSFTYYRLKQTDYDGQSEYSSTIAIKNIENASLISDIYPNTANSYFKFIYNGNGRGLNVFIYNSMSQLISKKRIENPFSLTEYTIKTDHLTQGIYWVNFIEEEGNIKEIQKLSIVK